MKTCIIYTVVILVACGELCAAQTATECPWVCTADFSPVCAKDAKGTTRTFSNRCWLKIYNECNDPNTGAPPKNKFVEIYEGACRKS